MPKPPAYTRLETDDEFRDRVALILGYKIFATGDELDRTAWERTQARTGTGSQRRIIEVFP